MAKFSRVLILGRTNIGKSTLFNRLSTNVKSLIFEQEGITRDYIKDIVNWKAKDFELVDSAGLGFKKSLDPLTDKVRLKALELLDSAQIVLFVVDGSSGILPEDYEIGKAIHKSGKPTLLLINKMDQKKSQENIYEFDKLGFKDIYPISAQHGTGITEVLDTVVELLKDIPDQVEEKPTFKLVLLGKPNVGKSSLMNALLQEQRSLVTEIPGTTREAVTGTITLSQETLELTDTPGVRRQRAIDERLEELMVKSAFRAVREADIILLLIDSSEGKMSDQELKLAYYVFDDQKKALIILFNKLDLMNAQLRADLDFSLDEHAHFFKRLITLNISVKNNKNLDKILPAAQKAWESYAHEFTTEELSTLFKQALIRKPLYRNGRLLRLAAVRQTKSAPITITFFVNEPEWFGTSQLGFFDNILRSTYDLKSVPIHFIVKKAA